MRKRIFNLSTLWFVLKYTAFLWVGLIFSLKVTVAWDLFRKTNQMNHHIDTLMYIFIGLLVLYRIVFGDSRPLFRDLVSVVLAHIVIGLSVFPTYDAQTSASWVWAITYTCFLVFVYLSQLYAPYLFTNLSESWKKMASSSILQIEVFAKARPSSFCFAVSVFLWIAYLPFIREAKEISSALADFSYLFMCTGLGLELYDMFAGTQRSPR